ncbi:MAG: sodium-dependent transporter [Lachnospiraceae bacterium]|nr:sodium-dependent transporter [Lachnospiraceae bacterium]
MEEKKKSSFSGSIGFVLAAAGSAVGLGNIWRFPYLAAKDGGGIFLLVYIVLAFTFGFVLLTTDIAIGRRTKQSAMNAFGTISKKWKPLGIFTFFVPAIIMTYYAVIGGWIIKYITVYFTGSGHKAASDGYFSAFITSDVAPIVFMLIFLAITSVIVYCGVEKGIEKFSKYIMPGLLVTVVIIAIFSLTLSHTDDNGTTRTGIDGFLVYIIPNFEGMTVSKFFGVIMDAMGQLFYSLSVAMGIMITYGSYVKDDVNLNKSIRNIEIFDTLAAFLAGLMIIPAVYVFMGKEGMAEGGPSLMFVSLPKVFEEMGVMGTVLGAVFFIMVLFAALTSSVSILETIVANCMEKFNKTRKQVSLFMAVIYAVAAIIICLGYNVFYFNITLPNGSAAQLLDVMDYVSNYVMMPIVSLLTCILIGWIVKPKFIVDEIEKNGVMFKRKTLYSVMVKFVAPVMLFVLFLMSLGLF